MSVHVCVRTYPNCMCVFTRMYVRVYSNVRVCLPECTCVSTRMYVRVYSNVRACLPECTCVSTRMYVHVSTKRKQSRKHKSLLYIVHGW